MVLPWRKPRAKKAPVKKAPAQSAPAKKAPVKKPPAKKAPVKKAPVKKAPVKKAPVKKAPAKKKPVVPDHPLMAPITTLPEWAHTLMGSGTEIIEFPETVTCPMVVQISHDGPDRFQFQFRDAHAGDEVFAITGTGSFNGRYSLNFLMRDGFRYVTADAKGSWILHFEPISKMRVLKPEIGATIEGVGSDVIQFQADTPMRLDLSAPHSTSTVVLFGNTRGHRRRLLWGVNGFEGTVLTEPHTMALEVVMGRPWETDARWTMTIGGISRPQT